jgi:flagellar motor switch protein FliN/FliY
MNPRGYAIFSVDKKRNLNMAETQTVQNEPPQTESAAATENTAASQAGTAVQQMELESVAPTSSSGQENLDLLLEIQMPITAMLGKAQIPLKKLLQLSPGTVLNLDKNIGQPAELFVQDIPFATADVVVVDNCFAVRIRELLGTEEPKPAAAAK